MRLDISLASWDWTGLV